MRNLWIFALFCVSQANFACHCESFNEVRKSALKESKFMLVHFTNYFTYETEDLNGNPIVNPVQENPAVKELLKNYKYVCVTKGADLLKKYNITHFPELLLIDGNGVEVYRFKNLGDSKEFVSVIENFLIPGGFLTAELAHYNKRQTFATTVRLAQKYLDYSLLLDDNLKQGVFLAANAYLKQSEKLIPVKDNNAKEYFQKLKLLELSTMAYQKNFYGLQEQLSKYDALVIYEANQSLYYFLKYITAKALHDVAFAQIEKTALLMDGFEYFIKKTDLILTAQPVAQAY